MTNSVTGVRGAGAGCAAPRPGVVIAVDGPSGSGKSSAARGVASALGLRYLDTGAMYRAVTWWMLEHDIDLSDQDAVAGHAARLTIDIGTDPADQHVRVDGIDVSVQIRNRRVSNVVSLVAAVPPVRRQLIALQQAVIAEAVAAARGIVAEGRDIGMVVAPDAPVKVFLTASEQVRAERRAAELAGRPPAAPPGRHAEAPPGRHAEAPPGRRAAGPPDPPSAEQTRAEQALRDRRDAPQSAMAADAVEIDATDLGLDDVIARIVALAAARGGA